MIARENIFYDNRAKNGAPKAKVSIDRARSLQYVENLG
jgi:hypothetical protein